MRIRFDAARTEPFRWIETVELSEQEIEGLGLLEVGPVACRGTVSFSDPDFVLQGGLSWELAAACDRCLAPVRLPAEAGIELVLVERPAARSGAAETELAEADLGVVEVQGDSFETRPLVLEQVALGVPMKPLCRDDCRGLCPVCGVDRNAADCACEKARVDSRWAGLAALKSSLPDRRSGES